MCIFLCLVVFYRNKNVTIKPTTNKSIQWHQRDTLLRGLWVPKRTVSMNGLVATNDDFNGNGKSERSKMDRLKYKFFPLNSHTSACDSCSIEITFCCTKINLYAIFTRPHAPSPSLPPPSYTGPLPVYWESQVGRCYFLLRDVRTFALTFPSVPYPPHSLSLFVHSPTYL